MKMYGVTKDQLAIFIKVKRELNGWTQYDLEEKSGIRQNQITRLEKGLHKPQSKTIFKILNVFECSIDDIKNFDPKNPEKRTVPAEELVNLSKSVSSHQPFQVSASVMTRSNNRKDLALSRRKIQKLKL